jgi:hypothetical protein
VQTLRAVRRDLSDGPPQDEGMTLSLVLLLALSQTEVPPAALPTQGEQPPAVSPSEKKVKEPPSVATRSLVAGGAGAAAGGVSLGIALLLVGKNDNFDATFATAALAALMITGVSFALHEALGGHGEVTLSFLFTAIVMAASAGISAAIAGGDRTLAPILTAAIGSIPAAAASVLALELTTPKPKHRVALSIGPTGIYGTF